MSCLVLSLPHVVTEVCCGESVEHTSLVVTSVFRTIKVTLKLISRQ